MERAHTELVELAKQLDAMAEQRDRAVAGQRAAEDRERGLEIGGSKMVAEHEHLKATLAEER